MVSGPQCVSYIYQVYNIWTLFSADAGRGTVEVTILDPQGHREKVKPTIHPINKDGVVLVEYTAIEMGLHTIHVSFSGTAIPKSPYGVTVGAAINAKAVYATGRGIQPRGVRIKQRAEFKVHTKDAGHAEVKVQIIGPGTSSFTNNKKPEKQTVQQYHGNILLILNHFFVLLLR